MPAGAKIWQLLPHDGQAIASLARHLGSSPIVAQLLLNRKIADPDQARRFLAAPLSGLHEPELLPGMDQAVERLAAAVRDQRRICVYGDYDVDGVTGTAILLTCLTLLGGNVEFHVPHRLEEGYGLNCATLRMLAERGVKLVVTVDCGIASVEEAVLARRLGLELVITDHHEPKETLPQADVLVHPRLPVRHNGTITGYPFGGLCGSGVAFKLAWALCKKHCGGAKVTPQLRDFLLDGVALAAMGTVADVVPLFEENRIFVRHGLQLLRQRPTLGLRALLKTAKLESKTKILAGDIGYTLAPRLNAAGRLGTARLAVELLTTLSAQRAETLADDLENQNHNRQLLERNILQEARSLAAESAQLPALVLANPGWHPGLLGIVASRLVEEYARPVLMIALRPDQPSGQGSGRSMPGFKLHLALQECAADLVSHGGHATAAGFRILPERITPFRERFCSVVRDKLGPHTQAHRLAIDAEVPLSSLTVGLMEAIQQLEPYGAGNPQPLFLADRLQIVGAPKRVGGGSRHLSFRVRQESRNLKAIAFGMADREADLMAEAGKCCLVFTPKLNEWQGYRNIDLEVRDFQAGPEARLGEG
jgi:single-stranded-DNA-specific exonuclease